MFGSWSLGLDPEVGKSSDQSFPLYEGFVLGLLGDQWTIFRTIFFVQLYQYFSSFTAPFLQFIWVGDTLLYPTPRFSLKSSST
jgi:hypothetical protein